MTKNTKKYCKIVYKNTKKNKECKEEDIQKKALKTM